MFILFPTLYALLGIVSVVFFDTSEEMYSKAEAAAVVGVQ